MDQQFVTYFRLSKQSSSGANLGLDAQRHSVAKYLSQIGGKVIKEFTEIESGRRTDRAELNAAIDLCRRTRSRLCIAKLDRLARNASFVLCLRDSGVDFVAADNPNANKLTVALMSVIAEDERDRISLRTTEALAEARRRGTKLGCPDAKRASALGSAANRERARRYVQNTLPIIRDIQRAGVTTLRGIAYALNSRGVRSPLNRSFSAQTVANVLSRADHTVSEPLLEKL